MGRPADDQLALVSSRRLPDVGVGREDGNCLNDLADAGGRIANIVPGEIIKNAVEIVAHFGRELDSRHVSREAGVVLSERASSLPADAPPYPPIDLRDRCASRPRNRLARRDDVGKSPLGNVVEVAAPFVLFGFLGDGFQDKTVRGLARTLGSGSDSGLEVVRNANGGRGHDRVPG